MVESGICSRLLFTGNKALMKDGVLPVTTTNCNNNLEGQFVLRGDPFCSKLHLVKKRDGKKISYRNDGYLNSMIT